MMKRKIVNFLLFILLSMMALAEVPHTYITDNPNTQINKIETIKEREKAELNLSVTKKKSKEIQGQLDESNKQIIFSLPQEINGKDVIIVEKLENLPNPSTVQGRKILSSYLNNRAISNNLTQEIKADNLIVNYENQPETLYISDLNGNFYKWNFMRAHDSEDTTFYFEIDDDYNGEPIQGYVSQAVQPKGIKYLYCDPSDSGLSTHLGAHEGGHLNPYVADCSPNITNIKYHDGYIDSFCLSSYPKNDFTVFIKYHADGSDGEQKRTFNRLVFKYIVRTLKGQSILTAKEYYPVNQFIKFNSTAFEQGSPLSLENSLRDVSLTTTGKGIVTMEQGDKLEIDGKRVVIGAGGNLAEQKATIGNLEYTYKVENGKLRLALNKWGVLEPDRNLMIRVWRLKGGSDSKLVEHTLTIKSPRRVEGSSQLNYDNDYQIRTFVRFGGISLTAPGISSLETPVPVGVSLSSQAGQGIPFMNEGDILEVNDGVTRAIHQFTIGAGGTLSKKQIKFNNSDVTLYVENGKLRAGLNNWIVNKPVKLNLRLIRGTNEIMNHMIGFKVPEAPFNIKKNGLLDFGRVTAGSKRTAETNIILEMLNDVDSVKFNLKDTQPVMENANGKQLQVNEIQTIVKKQAERTYLVKLHGRLVIPEDTQMGEYSGSTILELRIK